MEYKYQVQLPPDLELYILQVGVDNDLYHRKTEPGRSDYVTCKKVLTALADGHLFFYEIDEATFDKVADKYGWVHKKPRKRLRLRGEGPVVGPATIRFDEKINEFLEESAGFFKVFPDGKSPAKNVMLRSLKKRFMIVNKGQHETLQREFGK